MMHDIFDNVCHYNFSHILNHFIYVAHFFDLETFNFRLRTFEYGPAEACNIPAVISKNNLKYKKFKMTARQMMTVSQFFPLLTGDLVPTNDPV